MNTWRVVLLIVLMIATSGAQSMVAPSPAAALEIGREEFVSDLRASVMEARSFIRGMSIREVVVVTEVDATGATQRLRSTLVLNPDGTRYGTLESDGRKFVVSCLHKGKCYLKTGREWTRVGDRLNENGLTQRLVASDPFRGFLPDTFSRVGQTFSAVGPDGTLVVNVTGEGISVAAREESASGLLEAQSLLDYIEPRTVTCGKAPRIQCRVKLEAAV